MPSLLITAVDPATDQITIPAHGLSTGAGPSAMRNIGGSLPAPLAGLTDYWVIRVDANNVKLADSSAHALGGTPINLTTSGTGKLLLEVGIPYRRNTTYVVGGQVKSLDLDSFQDVLTALHDFLTGQAQSVWTGQSISRACAPRILAPSNFTFSNSYNANADTLGIASSAAAVGYIDLDVPVGYRLASVTFNAFGNASANLVITYETAVVATAGANQQAILTLNALSATPTDYTMNLLAYSAGLSVTVAAAGGTYTRSAGSFLTDGFFIGQQVQWSGFVNGGNNALKTITALTATVMTVSTTGLVNETGPTLGATVAGVSPVVDATIAGTQLKISASAININLAKLRYTMVPQ